MREVPGAVKGSVRILRSLGTWLALTTGQVCHPITTHISAAKIVTGAPTKLTSKTPNADGVARVEVTGTGCILLLPRASAARCPRYRLPPQAMRWQLPLQHALVSKSAWSSFRSVTRRCARRATVLLGVGV